MKKNKKTNRVAGLLIVFFVGTFSVVAGRFLYLQITGEVDGISLVEWAEEKRTSSHILDAERGKIHDANGMPLAYDRPTYRLYAIVDKKYSTNKDQPLHVKNPKKTAKKLAPILDIDDSILFSTLEQGIEMLVNTSPKKRKIKSMSWNYRESALKKNRFVTIQMACSPHISSVLPGRQKKQMNKRSILRKSKGLLGLKKKWMSC